MCQPAASARRIASPARRCCWCSPGGFSYSLDGDRTQVDAGDVIAVPAGSELRINGGDADAAAWVTTTIGLEATTSDGQRLRPPWTR